MTEDEIKEFWVGAKVGIALVTPSDYWSDTPVIYEDKEND